MLLGSICNLFGEEGFKINYSSKIAKLLCVYLYIVEIFFFFLFNLGVRRDGGMVPPSPQMVPSLLRLELSIQIPLFRHTTQTRSANTNFHPYFDLKGQRMGNLLLLLLF